jgi:hypothetical protein
MFRRLLLGSMTLLFLSADLSASGSIGGGAPRAENRAYSQGKQLYKTRIACDSCVMPGGVSNAEQARELSAKLTGEFAGLDSAQRTLVTKFLQRRFKL